MKTALLCILLCLLVCESYAQRRASANQNATVISETTILPIRRVILYSNGVAFIERRGKIRGNAEISLSFKQSQVDDVLKSIVVLDLGKGRIGAVSYNSSTPMATRMSEIPFAISASTSGNNGGGLAGVLSQLQGARVTVALYNRIVTGSILTVEARHSLSEPGKPSFISHRLVIATDNGELSGIDLADVRSIRLADEGTRRDLTEFAHAAASARRRDAKTIVISSSGTGERELVVSYTIAAPIWKTTYRVVLDRTGQPFFQGWAIVDNVGEEDWNSIQLSLVSGTPISFIQPIQNPVYRHRPVVPVSEDLNLRPQVYEPVLERGGMGSLNGTVKDPAGSVIPGASVLLTNAVTHQNFEVLTDSAGNYLVQNLPAGRYTIRVTSPGFSDAVVNNVSVSGGMRSNVSVNLDVGSVTSTVNIDSSAITSRQVLELPSAGRSYSELQSLTAGVISESDQRVTLSNYIAEGKVGIRAETTTGDIGDLFEYRIDQPLTVPRDRSALIPIVQTRMEGERVSIFSKNGPSSRPLSGLILRNTSALTLESGSLTVVEGDAYAGEALMERLKPSEERLVSFAVDLGTLVKVREEEDSGPTFLVKAVKGVIQAHYYNTRRTIYSFTNQTDRPRVVIFEHPVGDEEDWRLSDDTKKPEEKTAQNYRFRVELGANQSLEFPVTELEDAMESYALTNFTRTQLELFIARKYIDETTRGVLERLINLKDRIAATDLRIQELNKESTEIAQDQQRLRENIKAMNEGKLSSKVSAEARQLVTRYFAKANQQESRLEDIEKERRALVSERTDIQKELDTAIRNLSLERKIASGP